MIFGEIDFAMANIATPETTDWEMETRKNGEKSVPAMTDAAADFMRHSAKNDLKSIPRANKMTAFASPSLKNGVNLGKSSSA